MLPPPDVSAPSAPAARPLHVAWPHALLSVAGLAVSGYAWHVHRLIKAGDGSGCGISETISCDKVIGSRYGELFHIPLGVYGLLFFALVLLCSVSTRPGPEARNSEQMQRFAISAIGVLSSVALEYISLRVIGAVCPVCLTTHFITLLLFGASLWEIAKSRRRDGG